jgi:hypothetical protein
MPYVDLNTIHNPATGTVAPATWGDQVRDNLEFLIDPPACSVFNSAAQSLVDGVATVLNANSENFDNNAMHSTVTNNSRITIQTAGRYLLLARVDFAGNASGVREIRFNLNGSLLAVGFTGAPAGTAVTRSVPSISAVASVSDYFEIVGNQTSGGNLNVTLVEFTAIYLTR